MISIQFPVLKMSDVRGVHSTKKAFKQPGFLEAVAAANPGESAMLSAREDCGGVARTRGRKRCLSWGRQR